MTLRDRFFRRAAISRRAFLRRPGAVAFGQSSATDPFHLRELAEARAQRFEQFYEARARFDEPTSREKPRFVPHDLSEAANGLSGPALISPAAQAV